MNKLKRTLNYLWFFFLPMAAFSAFNGMLIGAIVSLYGFLSEYLVNNSVMIFGFVREHLYYIPLLFAALILLALVMTLLLKKTPECKGSGVPRTEGVLRGILSFRWLRTLLTTFFATSITYMTGLSLGSEGPSIQIGASLSTGACKAFKTPQHVQGAMVTGGAAAGLATAFNAPLTGIVFAVEEVHKKFSPILFISVAIAVLFSNIITRILRNVMGFKLFLLDFGALPEIPLKFVWALFLLGIVIGIFALLFNKLIFKANKLTGKFKKIPLSVRLITAFVLSGTLGLIFIDTLGGGHHLIEKVGNMDYNTLMIVLLFVVKLFLIIVCFSSGATGGLFIPMLTLGALLGGIMAKLLILMGLDPKYFTTVVVIAMTAFFGASVRAPLTAIILIVEITGQLSGFLMTGIAIFTAYFIPIMARTAPLYDGLLENIIASELPLVPPPYLGEFPHETYHNSNFKETIYGADEDDI